MNINIKNCRVEINTGKNAPKVYGNIESATQTENEGVIKTNRVWTLSGFMANKNRVEIGDKIQLPIFEVPAVKMDGKEVMNFDAQRITDEAIIIDKNDNEIVAIFKHCLFESAIDFNGEKEWEKTQLAAYLNSEFLRAMQHADIPAESCGLLSKEELWGKNALEYFKDGRNRIAFNFDENVSRWYWTQTTEKEASASYFCSAGSFGGSGDNHASLAYYYVRPRFTILNH